MHYIKALFALKGHYWNTANYFHSYLSQINMNSPYYADDRHKAIIGLRILSIITTLPVFPAVAWTMHAHADVVNDGVGWGFNPGVLAAVRSYTSSLSL